MTQRHIWSYGGIFFLAGSIILFEIAMTRVFAIMMWHHFSYMVISIALVGFGAAGSILTARRDALRTDPPFGALAFHATAYAVTAVGAFVVTTRIPIDSLEVWVRKANFLALFLIYTVLAVPLVFGGIAIGMALTRLVDRVNRMYFADLAGSAVGAAASTLVLAAWGNAAAVMTAAAGGALGGLAFSMDAPSSRRVFPAITLAAGLVLVAGFSGGIPRGGEGPRVVPALAWDVPFAPGKEMSKERGLAAEIRLPSATAEVSVSAAGERGPMIGGEFGARDFAAVNARVVTQDGTAPTMLFRNAASLAAFPFLDDTQAASAYVCHRAVGGKDPDVLVIGVGGGVDVMIALAHDARRVTAVEINSAMIRMVTDVFAEYTGGLLTPGAHALSGRIRLVHGEGRSYMRRAQERFDVIQMSGVDTFTALSMGAYTLSESYLYTVEAVKELYEHLQDGGYVNYSRFILTRPRRPRESIRLANIARTALEELGLEDPASRICVFQGLNWASTMIKRGRFTRPEIDALKRFAEVQGFLGLVFDPLEPPDAPPPDVPPTAIVTLPDVRAIGTQPFRHVLRELVVREAAVAAGETDLDALAAHLWDAIVARAKGDAAGAERALAAFSAWFPEPGRAAATAHARGLMAATAQKTSELVAGFQETRRDFSRLIRAGAAERARFVDAYEHDLSPCRDDRPFFFNYYKYSGLFRKGEAAGGHWYHSDFPIGHLVLLGSLVQIVLLGAVLILAPLRGLRRKGVPTPGKVRYLAYFSALGLGFMLIEIVMMQKMVLFLGHPTHALSVVLAALLASTGVGSLVSAAFPLRRRTALGILAAILVTTAGALFAANHLLPLALGQPLGVRIAAVTGLLAPLGVALGMAFPTGIRVVSARAPGLLPWAWAINGLTSVFASIFCIVLALEVGFTAVMVVAALVYAGGFLAVLREFGGRTIPA
jgi:hypothetical protein